VLVGGGLSGDVLVDDGVAVGDGDVDGLGDVDELGDEEELGDVDGLGEPEGPVALVVYVVAREATDTKMDCVCLTVPVPPGPLQHATTHSTVPGVEALTPPKFSRAPTGPCSVPAALPLISGPNGLVSPPLMVLEITVCSTPPGAENSTRLADVWKPLGHASVVFQVGVNVRPPVVALSTRLPGSAPTPASAAPAVTIAAPAIMPMPPRRKTARRLVVAARHLVVARRRAPEEI